MDKDRVKGAARTVIGKVKETVGKATGDQSTQAKGKKERTTGKVQNTYGRAKETVKK